jgi:hypothetical protein
MDYHGREVTPLITIVETPDFTADASRLMTDENREELIAHLAPHPSAGDLFPGTGGVRKLRWKLEGRGRRGGARVVHFFHKHRDPVVPPRGVREE